MTTDPPAAPENERRFTAARIEAVRQFALAQPRCSIDSRTILELVADWCDMASELDARDKPGETTDV